MRHNYETSIARRYVTGCNVFVKTSLQSLPKVEISSTFSATVDATCLAIILGIASNRSCFATLYQTGALSLGESILANARRLSSANGPGDDVESKAIELLIITL